MSAPSLVTNVCIILGLTFSGCGTADGGDAEVGNKQLITLPANQDVSVSVTSTDCNYLQLTIITWPDGSKSLLEADVTASPDVPDPDYDASAETTINYGAANYTTAASPQVATVEVFDKPKGGSTWKPTRTRKKDDKTVESEGHRPGVAGRDDWDDTIVSFSW